MGLDILAAKASRNAPAISPSMTRWSALSVTVISSSTPSAPAPTLTTRRCVPPIARMPACRGGLCVTHAPGGGCRSRDWRLGPAPHQRTRRCCQHAARPAQHQEGAGREGAGHAGDRPPLRRVYVGCEAGRCQTCHALELPCPISYPDRACGELMMAAKRSVPNMPYPIHILPYSQAGRACGGLMMAANRSVPNMPRLEMLNEPPMNSSGLSLFARARAASSRTCPRRTRRRRRQLGSS